ncbi:MAG: hypothetical protein ACRDBO_14160 [Lachnospiraceae bacterium]
MDNYLDNSMRMWMDNADRFERMFPDIHNRMQRHVRDIVDGLSDRDIENMTDDMLNALTNEAVRRSNILNDPPMGHNINTANDMARTLMVRDMMDRNRFGRDRFDFDRFRFSPLFFFPFDEFEFRRRRREDEERERRRREDEEGRRFR